MGTTAGSWSRSKSTSMVRRTGYNGREKRLSICFMTLRAWAKLRVSPTLPGRNAVRFGMVATAATAATGGPAKRKGGRGQAAARSNASSPQPTTRR